MSFLFSLFVVPFVVLGLLLTTKSIYFWLRKHPKLGQSAPNKAGLVAFIFAGLSAGLIAAPHFLTGALGLFNYVLAVVYVTFIVVGLVHVWKWLRLIWIVEDGDPTNDPKLSGDHEAHGDCGCPPKADEAKPAAPADGSKK